MGRQEEGRPLQDVDVYDETGEDEMKEYWGCGLAYIASGWRPQ